jgi:glutathione-independent formaldehyde dehydrogenase
VVGHETLGVVEEVGAGVTALEQGDRVVVPFAVACGFCRNCRAGSTGSCLTVAPAGRAGGPYGVAPAPRAGGQAEYLRVPFADANCLPLPAGTDHESDYVLLSDAFPTGYHGCRLAGLSPGGTVAVYGAGPLGLMAAYSTRLRRRPRTRATRQGAGHRCRRRGLLRRRPGPADRGPDRR